MAKKESYESWLQRKKDEYFDRCLELSLEVATLKAAAAPGKWPIDFLQPLLDRLTAD